VLSRKSDYCMTN